MDGHFWAILGKRIEEEAVSRGSLVSVQEFSNLTEDIWLKNFLFWLFICGNAKCSNAKPVVSVKC